MLYKNTGMIINMIDENGNICPSSRYEIPMFGSDCTGEK
jgi:hypothetical protein